MTNTDDDHLLMIEPTKGVSLWLDDELTDLATRVYLRSKPGNTRYKGTHTCSCGMTSDNVDHLLPGMTTNSLMVHYVSCHRDEVPQGEIDKLRRVARELGITS